MERKQVTSVVQLVVLVVFGQSQAAVAPSGTCINIVDSVPVDMPKLATLGTWKTLYGTDSEFVRMLDHATVVISTTDNKTFTSTATHVSKDNKTRISKSYTQTYNNGYVTEIDTDDQGNEYRFNVYALAKNEEDEVYLFYRCSAQGTLDVDTRYIVTPVIPVHRPISEETLKQLLSADSKYKFRGNLYKLQNEHI